MIITVLIHETGHLIFGLLTGYRLVSFKLLGLKLEDTGTGKRVFFCGITPCGQCLMYPIKENACPLMMILGGSAANLASGIMLTVPGFVVSGIVLKSTLLYLGSIGIAIGLYNLFLGSKYSDGNTYREIKRDKEAGHVYNNIMLIYRCLLAGIKYEDMPDRLFEMNREGSGPIYDEMREYIKRKKNGCSG